MYYLNETLITDSNGDSLVDILLEAVTLQGIVVRVDIFENATLSVDNLVEVTAESILGLTEVVVDTLSIGDIFITPHYSQEVGVNLSFIRTFLVGNLKALADTLDITADSSLGWNFTLFYANGTEIFDSDGDGIADLGEFSAGETKELDLLTFVPDSATLYTIDNLTIYVNSSEFPGEQVSEYSLTTVYPIIDLNPDYNRSVGVNSETFYEIFLVKNSFNDTTLINLNFTSTEGYITQIYASDRLTLLTDTDADGNVDLTVDGLGASESVFVKVIVPSTATDGDVELTTVNGFSSVDTKYNDSVLLNTTVRFVITYEDAFRITQENTFVIEDLVYVRATGITAANDVYFEYIDPNGKVIYISPDREVTAEDNSDDDFLTNTSLILGEWTVVAFNAQNDEEVGRNNFFLLDPINPLIVSLSPTAGSTYNLSSNVSIGANITDNYLLDGTWFQLDYPNGTSINYTLNNTVGDLFNYTFVGDNLTGRYNITFFANDSSGNINNTESTYFFIQDLRPDFTFTSLYFSDANPASGQNVTLFANVTNIGLVNGTNVVVQFFAGGVQVNGNLTVNLSIGQVQTLNVTYLVPGSDVSITAYVDPNVTIGGQFVEQNETNNEISELLTIDNILYQYYYGQIIGNITLADSAASLQYLWQNASGYGEVYVYDVDSNISFDDLYAIGYNVSGDQTSNDFLDVETVLNISSSPQSIVALWGLNDSVAKQTVNITVGNRLVENVPYINSTNSSIFITGILWDASDDSNGGFDAVDEEDLVFVTLVVNDQTGMYGVYDYEMRVPENLKSYKAAVDQVELRAELI